VAGAVERVFAPISASGGSAVPTGGWGTAGACSPGLQGVTGDMAARDWARAQIRPPQRGREERRGPEPPSVEVRRALGRTPLVEIVDADVYLERRRVLTRINWTVRPGERWAVLGPNGAGKSTLCGLVLGDLRPALGGMVRHFGVQGGELRAVQKRMGYVSAALQAAYVQPLTGAELVLSGFFASRGLYPLVERATEAQHAAVARWLEHFGLADLAGRPIAALSYGQMRRLLLARAAVAGPDLLVLDEPCSGLDAPSREAFLATLSGLARQGAAMVFVTHHPDELIPEIDHVLRLENGRIAAIAHEHPASGGRAGDAPNGMGADGAAS
jgi:ABC-type molybdenum transport system ATPase subunit/photorepair protein PhrA